MNKIEQFIELADELEIIVKSKLSWETKYELVFSVAMSRKIDALGFRLDYRDPDTTYEEDVMAYFRAVKAKADEFRSVFEE